MLQETNSETTSGPGQRRRLLVVFGLVVVLAVTLAVLLTVLLVRDAHGGNKGSIPGGGDATQVTSPYDLHELPAGNGPGDVKKASLVSISLPTAGGQSDYFGLSSETAAAQALIKAIAGADEVQAGAIATTTTVAGSSSAGTPQAGPTLTFLFPDRSTLAFDLYVAQGIIARGGHFWRVDGDLAILIDAAVSSHQQ